MDARNHLYDENNNVMQHSVSFATFSKENRVLAFLVSGADVPVPLPIYLCFCRSISHRVDARV